MAVFSLEALEAGKGDALLLYYGGDAGRVRVAVIDGGPGGIYEKSLRPRLQQLSAAGVGTLEMVMVSHIDDDHIHGVQDWFEEMRRDRDANRPVPFHVRTLWFNAFNEMLGDDAEEIERLTAAVPASVAVAGVRQGRFLQSHAEALRIRRNRGFDGLVWRADGGPAIEVSGGLTLRVLAPARRELEKLQKKWAEDLKKKPDLSPAEVAAFSDTSVANLSSIVVLAEFGGKRMLLTGDARGDHILDGLAAAGMERCHVDLLKMPHHGSNRNMTLGFLERVTADHYVISANGEHDNPDPEIFEWIAQARGAAPYSIYLTNQTMVKPGAHPKDVTTVVRAALGRVPSPGRQVFARAEGALSLQVNLLGPNALPDRTGVSAFL